MQPSTIRDTCAVRTTFTYPLTNGIRVDQASRTRDSRVRFRHRHAEIILSARFRAPEWGQALLEEWLMAQRGEEKPSEKF